MESGLPLAFGKRCLPPSYVKCESISFGGQQQEKHTGTLLILHTSICGQHFLRLQYVESDVPDKGVEGGS